LVLKIPIKTRETFNKSSESTSKESFVNHFAIICPYFVILGRFVDFDASLNFLIHYIFLWLQLSIPFSDRRVNEFVLVFIVITEALLSFHMTFLSMELHSINVKISEAVIKWWTRVQTWINFIIWVRTFWAAICTNFRCSLIKVFAFTLVLHHLDVLLPRNCLSVSLMRNPDCSGKRKYPVSFTEH
jgi:hypothetical protein